MDALNFLKFWRQATMTTTSEPDLVVETDTESDEDDSFFDLEITLPYFDNKENNNTTNNKNDDPKQTTTTTELKSLCFKDDELSETDNGVPQKTQLPVSPPEPISKRKILPIEPVPKPQSPIALLRSAPSFRIFMFRKRNRTPKTIEHPVNEAKVFAVKLSVDDCRSSPALSRDNSTRSFYTKLQTCSNEEPKPERFSKEVLRKYLRLIKPLYLKVSKRYSANMRFSGEDFAVSPSSSPSVASVSSRTEKQRKGMKIVSKHLGKSRSASAVAGVCSPAKSDGTLQLQHDGIQSAILHCKKSFNSREGSMYSVRKSFECEGGAKV